jgi:hypothetical protein
MTRRYKQAITGSFELPEVGGQRAFIIPSLDDKTEALDIIATQMSTKKLDLKRVRAHLTNVLFKSLPQGCEDTREDVDSYVVNNLADLWFEYLVSIDVMSKEDVSSFKKKSEDELKNSRVPSELSTENSN